MSGTSENGKRAMCDFCDRPQKTCLCNTLPKSDDNDNASLKSTSPHVEQILILQHPQEKKQKHCSDYFLLRTLANVHCVAARKLQNVLVSGFDNGNLLRIDTSKATSSDNILATKVFKQQSGDIANITSISKDDQTEHLEIDKRRTFVLYPHETAVTDFDELTRRLNPNLEQPSTNDEVQHRNLGIHTLIVVDATWQYAKEMIQNCEFMRDLPKVALSTDALTKYRSEFIVRKPERVKVGKDDILGFSTAEAVAIFLQEWCAFCGSPNATKMDALVVPVETANKRPKLETGIGGVESSVNNALGDKPTSVYEVVLSPLRKYVEYQLAYTQNVKHRTDRADYDPNLYAERQGRQM